MPPWPAAFSLKSDLALISGGGSGLGLAIGRCMASTGARVVLVGRREKPLQEAAKQIGARADYAVHDITKLAEADSLVEKLTQRHGPITILVNNAGIHVKKPGGRDQRRGFSERAGDARTRRPRPLSGGRPRMIGRRAGSILFMASMTSLIGMPFVVAYMRGQERLPGDGPNIGHRVFTPRACGSMPSCRAGSKRKCCTRPSTTIPCGSKKSSAAHRWPASSAADDIGMAAVYLVRPRRDSSLGWCCRLMAAGASGSDLGRLARTGKTA